MKAHIWLGLLVLPLAILHSGGRFGGVFSSLLMWLLVIVVGSGIVGLVMQNIVPRVLIERVPGETVAGQIDEVSRQLAEDARHLVIEVCDGAERDLAPAVADPAVGKQRVGVARRIGTARPAVLDPELTGPPRVNAPQLAAALRQEIEPFLRSGESAAGNLASAAKARLYFDGLRQQAPVAVHAAIERIESFCQRRRELTLQARLQFWLHAWLLVHLPLSILLVVLLAGHVYFALQFG
jgi:hypothetical protein